MLKANKDGKLIEFSLKQREQWLTYHYGRKRADSPFPFLEPKPTMTISTPPNIKRTKTLNG